MKKTFPILLILLILALSVLACSIDVNLTPEPGEIVIEPATETGGGAVPEVPTVPPPNVTCNNVSFYLDPQLGSSFSCETIPEANGPDLPYYGINPQYTKISIHGYPLAPGTIFDAHFNIYPFERFSTLIPASIEDYNYLVRLLGGELPGSTALPFLPYMGAAELFHAQYAILTFHNGSGIRYLTEFGQYFAPVNNKDLFYTFQGVTSDGQYWITGYLPVNHPMLPADAKNPPNGQSWEDFSNNYQPYITDMVAQLDAQSYDSYLPTLGLLDDLIASITVTP